MGDTAPVTEELVITPIEVSTLVTYLRNLCCMLLDGDGTVFQEVFTALILLYNINTSVTYVVRQSASQHRDSD